MPELSMCASIKIYHHVKPQSFHDIAVGMLGLDWENMGGGNVEYACSNQTPLSVLNKESCLRHNAEASLTVMWWLETVKI